jgi:hypothetical protein
MEQRGNILNTPAPGVLRRVVLYTFFIALSLFVVWNFFGEQGPPRSYFRTVCFLLCGAVTSSRAGSCSIAQEEGEKKNNNNKVDRKGEKRKREKRMRKWPSYHV